MEEKCLPRQALHLASADFTHSELSRLGQTMLASLAQAHKVCEIQAFQPTRDRASARVQHASPDLRVLVQRRYEARTDLSLLQQGAESVQDSGAAHCLPENVGGRCLRSRTRRLRRRDPQTDHAEAQSAVLCLAQARPRCQQKGDANCTEERLKRGEICLLYVDSGL